VGGKRLDEDLDIDPGFRAAVEAALADATRAYVVGADSVAGLSGERGTVVVAERAANASMAEDSRERRFRDRLLAAGGGTLDTAVRRDPGGAARRLLTRAAWLPDLAGCVAIQGILPPGWIAVPRDGAAVFTDLAVTLGAAESVLERRAEVARLTAQAAGLETEHGAATSATSAAASEAAAAAAAVEAARADEIRDGATRRAAEEAERLAARQLETVAREAAWHEAQASRLAGAVEGARAALRALEPTTADRAAAASTTRRQPEPDPADRAAGGLATWEARAVELRTRRDRLAESLAERDAVRRDAEHRRARAEAAVALAEERLARTERELTNLVERERGFAEERDALRDEIAVATAREAAAREALAAVRAADAAGRDRLGQAEREATAARDRLRLADERLRAADHSDLEARLGLEGLREGVIVELAGLGELAVRHLRALAGVPSEGPNDVSGGTALADEADVSDDVAALEAALTDVASNWAAEPPTGPPPSAARLGQLRRRFHDLGAVNPFAVDEYAAIRGRLETLETQAADLQTAIERTRELISELDTMIGDRFAATFRALETAFARRFEQLFGGGFAKLSLTDPTDIGASGIEIVARPPGKKPQALAMLSGGERALTAVALLFAMLEVRPVPFCVLDEVDAALDEANIGRFADALRSLAHQTQFIVITHNRGTIEAADALYGVTAGDDSVSRVISLRLDEAQALATRDRTELAPAG
jgi:chromosome segregation protein